MKDIIIDTLLDSLKLLPFLFIAFLIIESLEKKLTNKSKNIISKSGKYGPILGGLLGLIPQCGFSVIATNLYITRIVSLGTLISIYLSTSDEMLPIFLSEGAPFNIIIKILLTKLIFGLLWGIIIDFALRKRKKKQINYNICQDEHCDCENEGIIKSSIHHTLKTIIFILIISFIINTILEYVGEDFLSKLFLKNSFFAPFVSSLIGLIPNCGASVMVSELYLNNAINFATMISGLLTSSGVALLVLFKSNKNFKENISILTLLYIIGVISGILIEIFSLII